MATCVLYLVALAKENYHLCFNRVRIRKLCELVSVTLADWVSKS